MLCCGVSQSVVLTPLFISVAFMQNEGGWAAWEMVGDDICLMNVTCMLNTYNILDLYAELWANEGDAWRWLRRERLLCKLVCNLSRIT